MPQQGTPYLIPFGNRGMVSHPNRWRALAGEMTLAENVVVENDMLQKEPAAVYYAGAQSFGFLFFNALWSATPQSTLATADFFAASPSTTFLGVVFAVGGVLGSPSSFTFTQALPAGTFLAMSFSREAGTGGITTMVDTKGNTYTKVHTVTGSGMQLELWTSVLTTAATLSDTITITLSDPTDEFNLVGCAYAGVTSAAPVSQMGTFTGVIANVVPTPAVTSHTFPVLGIALVAGTETVPTLTFGMSYATQGSTAIGSHRLYHGARLYRGTQAIIAQVDWLPDEESAPGGTVSTDTNSTTVTGALTSFTTDFHAGDKIVVGGETQIVNTITNNTTLDTIDRWSANNSAVTYVRRAGPILVTAFIGEKTGGPGLPGVMAGFLTKETPTSGALGLHGNITASVLTSTLAGTTRRGRFVIGGKEIAANNRKLFFLNGIDPIQVIDGDAGAVAAIASPAADWGSTADAGKQPINAIVHQDSLMAFGNLNDPHRLYMSNAADHEDFTTAGLALSLRIASQVGERLYAAAQYQGVLFLWKYPRGIFYLDDTPIDRFQWSYRIRSSALGCAPSPHAVLPIEDDVIFCDSNGHFHLLSAVDTLGGTRDSDLTRALGLQQWTRANVDVASLTQLTSTYDERTKTAWFGCRSTQAVASNVPYNDLVIRWDFGQKTEAGLVRVTTSRAWKPNSLTVKRRNFTGVIAPLIAELADAWFVDPDQYGSRTNRDMVAAQDVTLGVSSTVTLPELDFADANAGNRHMRKHFHACELVAQGNDLGAEAITVALSVDGVLKQTLTFQQSDVRRIMKIPQCGDGYEISATITTAGTVAGDIPLLGLVIYYVPTSQDHSRKS